MLITAAVTPQAGAPFVTQSVELDEPRADEILVRVAGVGICHTDVHAQRGAISILHLPAVLGHEGSGIVERIGADVRKVRVGDRVLMSFISCGHCPTCGRHQPAYCHHFHALNLTGHRKDGSRTMQLGGDRISGSFFGQSSFASHALASESNVVPVPDGVPLAVAGVLGCGVQTGAGAILRSLDCRPGSTLLVTGGGSLGLSAVMAAKARGVARILLAEIQPARRALGSELGATDVIDPLAGDLTEAVLALLPDGVDYMLDTSGAPAVIEQAPKMLARLGTFGFVGLPPASHLAMPLPGTYMDAMRKGITFRGIIEGDSDVGGFIGELMDMYLKGVFPFDRLVSTFPLTDINQAIEAQHAGRCVKAVLIP